ncbi:60S ribosomal protein L37a-2 [Linum perenne]
MEVSQHRKYFCEFCGKDAVKRKAVGILYRLCRDCEEYHSSFEGADRELTSYKDFLEQQKAYFAEIDAFELSEEEVSSADELE